jgi:serine/threonine-protein kinase
MKALMSPPEPQVQAAPLLRAEFPVAFGRFLLLKRLSRGGMGEIFLAKIGEIAGFEKFVIIKKILPQLAANDDFIVRFIDEAQVAIKLNHVNIAQVYEVGRVDGEYFLAIEYIEGRDLRRLLRRCREMQRRLPVDLCLFIAREMASGLAYAHRRTGPKGQALALVHCDISPPNIMTSYEGEVKVIDFGIARSALRTADSNPNVGFGKFGYMAPEQLLRGGLIDRRTDIYAAGVVLYELLTGERLYQFPEGTDYRQMARVVCQGQFQLPSARDPNIDSDIDAIVSKALATRPEDRYQIAEEFRDALAAKLAQLAPTMSADTLAATMDELFVGERQREQDELLQLRAVDASAYKEELVGSVGHTVTFARAVEEGAVTALPPSGTPPPSSSQEATRLSQKTEIAAETALRQSPTPTATPTFTHEVPQSRRRAGWLLPLLLGGGAFLVVGGGGALRWYLQSQTSPPPAPVEPAAPLPEPPKPIAEPMVPPPAPPAPPPTVEPPPPRTLPIKRLTRPPAKARPPTKSGPPASEAELVAAKRLEVDRKFQQVKSEYLEFKRNFGARLEDRWQQILSDIALGRRDQGLSDALDTLRRDMKRASAANTQKPPP